MAEIERDGVAGQQPPHEVGQGDFAGAQQQMKMVVDQRPGEAVGFRGKQKLGEPMDELVTILIFGEVGVSRCRGR